MTLITDYFFSIFPSFYPFVNQCRAPEPPSDRESTLTAATFASDPHPKGISLSLPVDFFSVSLFSLLSLTGYFVFVFVFIILVFSVLAASGFNFSIERRVRLRQLRVEGDAQPTRCDYLCAGAERPSGEQLVFFVDEANACVKALAISTSSSTTSSDATCESKPVSVYRSPKDGVPRVVDYVRGSDLLLVVEALLNRASNRKKHFLLAIRRQKAVDADGADSWRVEQRERLTTTPTAWDEERFMQLHALPDGRLLCGMSKSKQLELFDTSSSASTSPQASLAINTSANANPNGDLKLLRSHAVLHLHFKFFSFALGVVDGAALLFASVEGDEFVRILRLSAESAPGPPTAQPLRFIEADASRLLWRGSPDGASGHLLCGQWDKRQYAHSVDAWRVSCGGQSTELMGSALSVADGEGFDIECWCSLSNDKIIFNDMHRAQLVLAIICDSQ